jgi:hypothetical protein
MIIKKTKKKKTLKKQQKQTGNRKCMIEFVEAGTSGKQLAAQHKDLCNHKTCLNKKLGCQRYHHL